MSKFNTSSLPLRGILPVVKAQMSFPHTIQTLLNFKDVYIILIILYYIIFINYYPVVML